ncbi:MAG: hypothetical protein IIV96_05830, partial [Ruminococcus sp.]|nr:hypothetical protein [Ruminococcus sp.]
MKIIPVVDYRAVCGGDGLIVDALGLGLEQLLPGLFRLFRHPFTKQLYNLCVLIADHQLCVCGKQAVALAVGAHIEFAVGICLIFAD